MMTQEYDNPLDEQVEIPLQDRGIPASDPGPTAAQLALLQRRELAITATDAVSEVFEVDVTIPVLQLAARKEEKTQVRLAAVRALRCIEAIAREDSAVMLTIGEGGIYDYVEGVIQYGASEKCYLDLVRAHQLDAAGVTALYEIREQIAAYCDGRKPGFRVMHEALLSVGYTAAQAAQNPEGAVQALDEAGYFIDHVGNSRYSRIFPYPIFSPDLAASSARVVEADEDIDGSLTKGILEGFRNYFNRPLEETED